jgi:acetyltransferase
LISRDSSAAAKPQQCHEASSSARRASGAAGLQHFFAPASVAVIGASTHPGKIGHDIVRNLQTSGFKGAVYPINPKAPEILGLRAYASVLAVDGSIDLVVIAIPAKAVLPVMEECAQKGVDSVIVITAGFKESGPEGMELEKRLEEIAGRAGIRVVGPNCLGIIATSTGLNASFAPTFPRVGSLALMSQSGALATAILDWSVQNGIGYSKFVSFGNGLDVGVVDLLRAWEDDPETRVIVAYMEGLPNGPEFMRVAKEVSRKKPVIVVKSGNTRSGARAVSSHTGSLAGSGEAYQAAFKQCGVIRAHSMEELFDLAVAFAYQDVPRSRRVAILTNAGGPGIMATDAVETAGLEMATITPQTVAKLGTQLPPAANLNNPVDCLGDADAERYTFTAETVLADPNVDAALALLTPQTSTQPYESAQGLAAATARSKKPVLACFMGGGAMTSAIELLVSKQVPNYSYPERAVQALATMVRYREWREEPEDEIERFPANTDAVKGIFGRAREEGRVNLGEIEAREVLQAYHIRMPESRVAQSAEEAARFADEIGYPVVMKIVSPDILHKSDIGGVRVGIASRQEAMDAFDLMMLRIRRYAPDAELRGVSVQEMVRSGREVILGSTRDPQFGPLVMFGLGGIYVEVLKDVSFRVAPFGRRHARQMVDEVRSAPLLRGARGERPCDLDAIVTCLLILSQLVTDFPEIVEMDVNPLKVGEPGTGAVAVDARITITEH